MVLIWLVTGCVLNVVPGSGVVVTEEREVAGFEAVHNATLLDVTVALDPQATGTATVTCDDNLLSSIHTEAQGDTLRVEVAFGTRIAPSGPCTVVVHTPLLVGLSGSGSGRTEAVGDLSDLSSLEGSGSGRVAASGALANLSSVFSSGSGGVSATGIDGGGEVQVEATGSGEIRLVGAAPSASLFSSGSGGIDARDLEVDDADVELTGSGDAWLTATRRVRAFLSGSGDLHVFGGAEVDERATGSGGVIAED